MTPIRLLVVDADSFFARMITHYLEVKSVGQIQVVATVERCEAAVAQIPSVAPQAILIEMTCPIGQSVQVIQRLRSLVPQAAIIGTTPVAASEYPFYREAALGAGANDFIPKSELGARLIPAIQRILNILLDNENPSSDAP